MEEEMVVATAAEKENNNENNATLASSVVLSPPPSPPQLYLDEIAHVNIDDEIRQMLFLQGDNIIHEQARNLIAFKRDISNIFTDAIDEIKTSFTTITTASSSNPVISADIKTDIDASFTQFSKDITATIASQEEKRRQQKHYQQQQQRPKIDNCKLLDAIKDGSKSIDDRIKELKYTLADMARVLDRTCNHVIANTTQMETFATKLTTTMSLCDSLTGSAIAKNLPSLSATVPSTNNPIPPTPTTKPIPTPSSTTISMANNTTTESIPVPPPPSGNHYYRSMANRLNNNNVVAAALKQGSYTPMTPGSMGASFNCNVPAPKKEGYTPMTPGGMQ